MDPGVHCVTIGREGSSEGCLVIGEAAAGGAAICNDHPHANECGRPAPLPGKVACEPPIAIHLSDDATDIADRALYLDDQDGAPAGMPGHDVDRASLAVDRKRDLGMDDPFGQAGQSTDECLDHPGVASIDEPVEVASTPSGNQLDARVHSPEYPPQHDERGGIDAAVLEARDGRRRQPSSGRELDLRPALPIPERPDHGTESNVVHGAQSGAPPLSGAYRV